LFCRLLLSHATLLPAVLKANSVEEFLNDQEISTTDLRDLCLRMEKPDLQDIRDTCADLARGRNKQKLMNQKSMKRYKLDPGRRAILDSHSVRNPVRSPVHGSQRERNNCRSGRR